MALVGQLLMEPGLPPLGETGQLFAQELMAKWLSLQSACTMSGFSPDFRVMHVISMLDGALNRTLLRTCERIVETFGNVLRGLLAFQHYCCQNVRTWTFSVKLFEYSVNHDHVLLLHNGEQYALHR